jgi:hypothetical protein
VRNWDLREFCVRVKLQCPLLQVCVPIRRVITPICGIPDPNRQVVPLISHIHSYPPHHSHLHPPSFFLLLNSTFIAEHQFKSSLSISLCHDHELTLSTAYTEYSIHRVQHTPSTAYTEYSIHRVQHTPTTAYTKYSICPRLFVLPSFS